VHTPFTDISTTSWLFAFSGAIIIGISKAGIKGLSVITVALMALAFGAKESTGLLVPILVLGDLFAVIYYNRHTQWKYIFQFLPWIVFGLILGVVIGKDLPGKSFKISMGIIILISLLIMFLQNRKKIDYIPTHWTFAGSMGIMTGITTMIGNLSGAFSNIFFLAMRLPKNEFIGTAAWLFLIINVIKLPFHFFVWNTITQETILVNLKLLPGVFLGLFLGFKLVKIIKNEFYRKMILILTAIGAILLFFR